MSRLGVKEQRDAEDRIRRPFDLVLTLAGSKAPWFFGRFRTEENAVEAGEQALRATRRDDLPYGRKCLSYRVVDTRAKATVAHANRLSAAERNEILAELERVTEPAEAA